MIRLTIPRYGGSASRRHQGHRTADQEADGDGATTSSPRRARRTSSSARPMPAYAVLHLGQLHPHALPDAHQARERRSVRASAERTYHDVDDRSRQTERRVDPGPDRRARHRRQHDRHVQHRQRAAPELMARCRDAVLSATRRTPDWEGAYRVPSFIRWPGKIKAGSVSNEIMSSPGLGADVPGGRGRAESRRSSKKGHKAGDKTYKVHLDGYNLLPYLTGRRRAAPAIEFFYFSDDGDLMALRYKNWKVHFMVQDQKTGTWRSGSGSSGACVCRTSSTCEPIPTSIADDHLEHLLGLVHRSRVDPVSAAGCGRRIPRRRSRNTRRARRPRSFTIGDAFESLQAVPHQ